MLFRSTDLAGILVASLPVTQVDLLEGIAGSSRATKHHSFGLSTEKDKQSRLQNLKFH